MGLFGGNTIAFSFLLSCCLIIRLRYRPRIETRRDSERAAPPLWVSTNGEWERFPLWALGYLFFFAMSILTTLALCSHFSGLGTGERKDGSGKKH